MRAQAEFLTDTALWLLDMGFCTVWFDLLSKWRVLKLIFYLGFLQYIGSSVGAHAMARNHVISRAD